MAEGTVRSGVDKLVVFSPDVIIKAIKRRVWIAAVAAVLVGGVYFLRAWKNYVPLYSTSSSFAVAITNDYGVGTSTYNNTVANQMSKTFPYILESGVLQDLVANDLQMSAMPGSLAASAVDQTNLFTLTATAYDPQMAYDILQSAIKNYPQISESMVGPTVMTLLEEEGVVTTPINSVGVDKAIEIGLIAGLAVAVVVVLLYAMMNQTVCRVEDIKGLFNARCLASVPSVLQKNRRSHRTGLLITQKHVSRSFIESIYRVRTAFERSGSQVLLVTSSLAGEGKSTLSVNMALSLAKSGKRVALIDADLRHPLIGRYLGIPDESCAVGISNYLRGDAQLNDIGLTVANMNNLIVIPGGTAVKNSSELLDMPAMKELIALMREQMDYVIIDSPPCTVMADSAVLGRYADNVLYVIRQDYSSFDAVIRGTENATMSGVPLLGFVLNRTKRFSGRYYEYDDYYYGIKKS